MNPEQIAIRLLATDWLAQHATDDEVKALAKTVLNQRDIITRLRVRAIEAEDREPYPTAHRATCFIGAGCTGHNTGSR